MSCDHLFWNNVTHPGSSLPCFLCCSSSLCHDPAFIAHPRKLYLVLCLLASLPAASLLLPFPLLNKKPKKSTHPQVHPHPQEQILLPPKLHSPFHVNPVYSLLSSSHSVLASSLLFSACLCQRLKIVLPLLLLLKTTSNCRLFLLGLSPLPPYTFPLLLLSSFDRWMRPHMEGVHSAETDCIPRGANLTGLELAKGESHTQNASSTFLHQHPCWAPHVWHQNSGGEALNYGTARQWHLKSPIWDYNMSGDTVIRSTQGNDWGTDHDEGFILGGGTSGNNRYASHFLPPMGFPGASMAGNDNSMIRSSPTQNEAELKLSKGWMEHSSELNALEFRKTDSKVQLERECQTGEEQQKPADTEGIGNCGVHRNGSSAGDASMGLRLGKRTYYEDGGEGGLTSKGKAASSVMPGLTGSTPVKKQRVSGPGVRCQVDSCKADLSDSKDYHRRHKVCEMHSKAPKVIWKGKEHRFCQQCSRFHELMMFDDSKRSCRRRLADHNERRRKPVHDTSAMIAAAASINQDRSRSAATSIMERPYFMQHPALSATSVFDGSESRRGWPRYENRVGDDQMTLACRMQVLNHNGGGGGGGGEGGSSSPSPPMLPPNHVATTADRLLMMLQAPNKPSSTREMLHPHRHHHHLLVGQGLTLSSSTGPSLLSTSLGLPAADCGRALSLLSSQSLPLTSNAEKFIDQNSEFINNHTCGASATSAQLGFSVGAATEDKMFGLSLAEMDHHQCQHHHHGHQQQRHHHHSSKEEEEEGSLIPGLGDPMLAQLLQGQGFRSLDTQQVRRTLDLMQLPASQHPHLRDENGGGAAFAELQSFRPYETSIFEHHQQLI